MKVGYNRDGGRGTGIRNMKSDDFFWVKTFSALFECERVIMVIELSGVQFGLKSYARF